VRKFLAGVFAASRRGSVGITLLIALGLAGCGGEDSSSEPDLGSAGDTSSADSVEHEGSLTYVALGDSWPAGDNCSPACRTFPQGHADALEELLGEPVLLYNLAGHAQPYFYKPGGDGSTGLLKALRTDEAFRDEVAGGDIIVISTGPNDGGPLTGVGAAIMKGKMRGRGRHRVRRRA
jgi:hypothetical protein